MPNTELNKFYNQHTNVAGETRTYVEVDIWAYGRSLGTIKYQSAKLYRQELRAKLYLACLKIKRLIKTTTSLQVSRTLRPFILIQPRGEQWSMSAMIPIENSNFSIHQDRHFLEFSRVLELIQSYGLGDDEEIGIRLDSTIKVYHNNSDDLVTLALTYSGS